MQKQSYVNAGDDLLLNPRNLGFKIGVERQVQKLKLIDNFIVNLTAKM